MASSTSKPGAPTTPQKKDTSSYIGYVGKVSELRSSAPKPGKKSCSYFDFLLHTKQEVKRAVCFSPQKRKRLLELDGSGVEIKQTRISSNGTDIVLSEKSTITKIDLNFKKIKDSSPVITIDKILNECQIYDVVSIKAYIANLSPTESFLHGSGSLTVREATATDNTGEIGIRFYNKLCQEIKDSTTYEILNVSISTFDMNRILKTQDRTEIKVLEKSGINVPKPASKSFNGKVCMVDFHAFDPIYKCLNCGAQIDDNTDGICVCPLCHMSADAEDVEIAPSNVPVKVKKDNGEIVDADLNLITITEAYDVDMKTDKSEIVKKMLRSKKNFTISNNKVTKISDPRV